MQKNIPNKRTHITGKLRRISLYYVNMSTSLQLTTTAKGRPLMVLDGYSYIRDRQTDEKTHWPCENHEKFNCHYRIHTCNFTTNAAHANILKCNGVHTTSCHRGPLEISLGKFHEDLDRTKSTQESTDIVLWKCLTELWRGARLRLPPLDDDKRPIRHHRKENDLPSILNDVNFPPVPTSLKFTKRNELFLRIDMPSCQWYTAHKWMKNIYRELRLWVYFRYFHLGPDRILIFSSPEQSSMLQASTEFLLDGTFDASWGKFWNDSYLTGNILFYYLRLLGKYLISCMWYIVNILFRQDFVYFDEKMRLRVKIWSIKSFSLHQHGILKRTGDVFWTFWPNKKVKKISGETCSNCRSCSCQSLLQVSARSVKLLYYFAIL